MAAIDFVTKYHVMPTDTEMGGLSPGDLFKAGKLAMEVTGIWMFAAYKDAPFEWDIQVEPAMKEKATHFFANAVSVFAATKHLQEAWEWVKFFTSNPEMASIRVKTGSELLALDNPAFFEDYLEAAPTGQLGGGLQVPGVRHRAAGHRTSGRDAGRREQAPGPGEAR